MMTPDDATRAIVNHLPCGDRGDIIHVSDGGPAICYCNRFGQLTPLIGGDVEQRTCLVCQSSEWPAESGRHDRPTTSGILTSELSRRARSWPEESADASGVTLCCVDCVNPDLAAFALDVSRRGARFDRVILVSDERPSQLPGGIEFVRIPQSLDKDGYNLFMLRHLHSLFISTSHVLTIQSDGFLLRPETFDRDWLEYDYVGAPWPPERWHADKSLVGNSGCCIRSRKLLMLTAELATDELIASTTRGDIYDDVVTCHVLHDELVKRDCRFAPPDIAADFSVELSTRHGQFIGKTCGYHGRRHAPTHWLERELSAWKARTKWRHRGGEIRLCMNRYVQGDVDRQVELDECYRSNGDLVERWTLTGDGVPVFAAFVGLLDWIQDEPDSDAINIFCNSDVYFDDSIIDLCRLGENDFACLTRHEKDGDGWRLWEECGHRSQDAWAYRGRCKIPIDKLAAIKPGAPGVDNHIAWLAWEAGYNVVNPSRDVRVFHLHAEQSRRAGIGRERIKPPYLHVWPHRFGEEPRTEVVTEYDGPGHSAVYHQQRLPTWETIMGGDSMIYMSIDVEQFNGGMWLALQEHAGAVVQYPHALQVDDICLVEATLGSEFLPKVRVDGSVVVAVLLADYHLQRERTGNDQWNILIHRIETCMVAADRVAVVTDEMAGVAREVIDRNGKAGLILVDVVADWVWYVNWIKW